MNNGATHFYSLSYTDDLKTSIFYITRQKLIFKIVFDRD